MAIVNRTLADRFWGSPAEAIGKRLRVAGGPWRTVIGIRMALGATRVSVVRAFVANGLRLGGIGAALGLLAALAGGDVLERALYGVSATDVVSYSRALATVLGIVIVATLVPAWRAARTNPLSALRHQ